MRGGGRRGSEGSKPSAASRHGVSRRRRQKARECVQLGRLGETGREQGRNLPALLSGGASAAGWGEQPPVAGAAD